MFAHWDSNSNKNLSSYWDSQEHLTIIEKYEGKIKEYNLKDLHLNSSDLLKDFYSIGLEVNYHS